MEKGTRNTELEKYLETKLLEIRGVYEAYSKEQEFFPHLVMSVSKKGVSATAFINGHSEEGYFIDMYHGGLSE